MRLYIIIFTFHAHAPTIYIEYDFNYMKGAQRRMDVVPPLQVTYTNIQLATIIIMRGNPHLHASNKVRMQPCYDTLWYMYIC